MSILELYNDELWEEYIEGLVENVLIKEKLREKQG